MNNIINYRKFVTVDFTKETNQKLIQYCLDNRLDLITQFDKSKLKNPMDFWFHVTLIYSNNYPNIIMNNGTYELPSFNLMVDNFGVLGPKKDCLVLLLKRSEELDQLRYCLEKDYGLLNDYMDWIPHVTLTYNYEGEFPKKLPDFSLEVNKLTIKNILE